MKPGTIVKYTTPQNEREALARFVVVEDRDTRVLIRLVCDLPIAPTEVVDKGELVEDIA